MFEIEIGGHSVPINANSLIPNRLKRSYDAMVDVLDAPRKKTREPLTAEAQRFEETLNQVETLTKVSGLLVPVAQGANGARVLKDLTGKRIAIFKAPIPYEKKTYVHIAKSVFGQNRLLNQRDNLAESFNEYVGYKFSSHFGFHIAPPAKMVTINGEVGALIHFLDGFRELKGQNDFLNRETYTEQEQRLWQLLSLFNFLIGNLDPHTENIFVKVKNGYLQDVRMIDFGNTMIQYNPDFGTRGHQGDWGKHKIAEFEFLPDVLTFIRDNLSQDRLEQFISTISRERFKYWTPQMESLLRDRFAILNQCVLSGQISSPKSLSQIHTTSDFDRLLKRTPVSLFQSIPSL